MPNASPPSSSPSTHAAWRLPGATLLWAAFAVAVYAIGEPILRLLEYDRAAIGDGAVFRLFTGHFTHFSPSHLFWDVLMFLGLGAWIELDDRRAWRLVVFASAAVIGLGLLAFDPLLLRYRGLSGIDSALFALIAARWTTEPGGLRWIGGAALLGLIGKSVFEWATGAALFADLDASGACAVPLAHLLGAVVGVAVAYSAPSHASVRAAPSAMRLGRREA